MLNFATKYNKSRKKVCCISGAKAIAKIVKKKKNYFLLKNILFYCVGGSGCCLL